MYLLMAFWPRKALEDTFSLKTLNFPTLVGLKITLLCSRYVLLYLSLLLLQLFIITYDPLPIYTFSLFYQDLSMEMKAGQITALVGLNRSGKSTCVKLLERFYQPEAGEILLDGKPLLSYKDQYLHDKVGG